MTLHVFYSSYFPLLHIVCVILTFLYTRLQWEVEGTGNAYFILKKSKKGEGRGGGGVKFMYSGLDLWLLQIIFRYSHKEQIQVRLSFLTCVFSAMGSPDGFSMYSLRYCTMHYKIYICIMFKCEEEKKNVSW